MSKDDAIKIWLSNINQPLIWDVIASFATRFWLEASGICRISNKQVLGQLIKGTTKKQFFVVISDHLLPKVLDGLGHAGSSLGIGVSRGFDVDNYQVKVSYSFGIVCFGLFLS